MKQNEVILYGKGAYGFNIWKIWSEANIIHIEANGQRYTEEISEGKQSRSISEQIKLRLDSRVRNKMDSGFKYTKEEAEGTITNQLGFAAPMLAKSIKDIRGLDISECAVQPKLDGHRCLINREGAYSRRGKVIDTVPEIIDCLNIPEGITLDGELYCHGVPLQTIASWAKRRQPETLKLQYHVYDVIIEDVTFFKRRVELAKILKDCDPGKIIPVVTMFCNKNFDPFTYCQKFRELGYEGAMLRPLNGLYEIGKRSKDLIKVKMRYDAEFICVGIEESKDGWAVLWLKTESGDVFKASAPGTHYEKKHVIDNKEKYIGRIVTCEYAELTNSGIPFHCVATRWRVDI